jgi:CubicO group peptidase (beta-lactamase class C family)
MSSKEMIERKTSGVSRAVITVGVVKNGEMSFTVYGENGRIQPNIEHIYEIGSITKPITAQLFARAISENRVSLDDQIDRFLNLPPKAYYPTIRRLLTHTAGYTIFEADIPFIFSVNSAPFGIGFYGLTRNWTLNRIGEINLTNRDYPFSYGNFGFGVAGLVLEEIYGAGFTSLINNYLKNDLGLNNTRVGDGRGDLSNYWRINDGNPLIPAGALVSTITDMMKFAQMQIDESPSYVNLSHTIMAQGDPQWYLPNPELGLRVDALGLGWFIDTVDNIIWHSGETTGFSSYLGIDKANQIAVVVLSNMRSALSESITSIIGRTIIRELK